jgi:DNA-binding NarL/FixJ family response regulator
MTPAKKMRRPTVLLADDHAIVVEGLRRVLEPTYDVVGVVPDGRALLAAVEQLKPNVIVLDVSMPLLNGIEAARQIRKTDPKIKIVFLSMHPDVIYVTEALQAGGSAYVLKSSAGVEILTAVGQTLQGKTYVSSSIDKAALEVQIKRDRHPHAPDNLSQRQREVLQLASEGRSTKEIAKILHVSPRTVEFHRYRLMKTLGLRTTAELVQYAIRHRLISS